MLYNTPKDWNEESFDFKESTYICIFNEIVTNLKMIIWDFKMNSWDFEMKSWDFKIKILGVGRRGCVVEVSLNKECFP
jgi:hypothetical protein